MFTANVGPSEMKQVRFGRWEVEADVEATAASYAQRVQGAPEECGCLECRNFAAARATLYPTAAVQLFESLGVRPIREAEIWHNCEIRPGVHSYGGFMHVIGRILSGQDVKVPVGENIRQLCPEPVTPSFSIGFSADVQLVPDCFPKSGLFQIEFECQVPWVFREPDEGPTTA